MEKFVIKGLTKGVKGLIDISGSKNAVLPLMFSSILFNDIITLKNVPFVSDVITTKNLLESLGSKVEISEKNKTIKIINKKKHKLIVPYKSISTMRAGVLAMGALLGRYQVCSVSRPGGCSLGSRPIGWHLKGFNKLGAKYSLNKGYINVSAKNGLKGNVFKFPKVSVTGTSNLIMASIYVKGTTTLENISIEPEVIELIRFLNRCKAQIRFKGKRTIQINGVKKLKGCTYEVIGDRIEAFSYLCTAAMTKGKIKISKINPKYLKSELQVLKKIGCDLNIKESTIVLSAKKKIKIHKNENSTISGFRD